jgi:serine/threonine protein kinase
MALIAGTRLGSYEILAPLGAGGMGEVYRARDTKLKREVALKVLPDSFAADPERMARFQREAEVLASLNHPHIAQIYGVEERALVMELVPGESLKGPLPLETALNYAKQIVDALEAAHEKGIVHRDLKPANIMITPEGVVKVLDFGLAAVGQSSDYSDPVNSPTLTISPTRAGMILGTAAYMSPEQARGKTVDKRSDIWAFGVVLYEMLTGKRLFEGETISDTLAAVLKTEPDLTQVPAQAQRLLRRCLEKDPRKRLRDIGDARIEIDESLAGKDSRQPPPLPEDKVHARSLSRWSAVVIVGSAAVVVAVVLGYLWLTRPVPSPKVLGSTQITRDGLQKTSPDNFQSLWTDGSRLYFNEAANGSWGIAFRPWEAKRCRSPLPYPPPYCCPCLPIDPSFWFKALLRMKAWRNSGLYRYWEEPLAASETCARTTVSFPPMDGTWFMSCIRTFIRPILTEREPASLSLSPASPFTLASHLTGGCSVSQCSIQRPIRRRFGKFARMERGSALFFLTGTNHITNSAALGPRTADITFSKRSAEEPAIQTCGPSAKREVHLKDRVVSRFN